jgi:hypothetical protein
MKISVCFFALILGNLALAQSSFQASNGTDRENYTCNVERVVNSPEATPKAWAQNVIFGKDIGQMELTPALYLPGKSVRYVITRRTVDNSITVYATDGGKRSERKQLGRAMAFEDGKRFEYSLPSMDQKLVCATEKTLKPKEYVHREYQTQAPTLRRSGAN